MRSGNAKKGGRVNALKWGSVHYPRAPTPEPCNKERAPTQEPASALKTKGVTARVSGLCSVLAGRAGFSFSGALLPARSWLPRVGLAFLVSFVALLCPWFLVVSFRGPEVVKKFEEQAGADPITELSCRLHPQRTARHVVLSSGTTMYQVILKRITREQTTVDPSLF